jgi:hypothetical protein
MLSVIDELLVFLLVLSVRNKLDTLALFIKCFVSLSCFPVNNPDIGTLGVIYGLLYFSESVLIRKNSYFGAIDGWFLFSSFNKKKPSAVASLICFFVSCNFQFFQQR